VHVVEGVHRVALYVLEEVDQICIRQYVGGGDERQGQRVGDVALILVGFAGGDGRIQGVGNELTERPLCGSGFVFQWFLFQQSGGRRGFARLSRLGRTTECWRCFVELRMQPIRQLRTLCRRDHLRGS